MAVPKKRTGHSAQGSRRSNWKATKPETTKCPNCGATVLAHTICTACGTYKGKPVSLKDRVEEVVVEEKKPAKKSTAKKTTTAKKSTKKATVKAEEAKVEETPAKEITAEEVKEEK